MANVYLIAELATSLYYQHKLILVEIFAINAIVLVVLAHLPIFALDVREVYIL